jgi:hypothetical protein
MAALHPIGDTTVRAGKKQEAEQYRYPAESWGFFSF